MDTDELKRNIDTVSARIARAAAGRRVTLVAASKTVPAEVISAAVNSGITDVGENRVQEYLGKKDFVSGANWHFIGTLQSNKAKYLVGSVALIQSVNSLSLAQKIDDIARERGVVQDVLAEINICAESSKTGASADGFFELVEQARRLKNIRVRGIMAVPPFGAGAGVYKHLLKLFESLGMNGDGDILSVGMSGDYELAVENGSNMVRIGTALFGQRTNKGR